MAGLGGTFAFGPYTATFGGSSIGQTEGPKRLRFVPLATLISADQYGQTPIDGIYQGGQAFMTMVLKEWTSGVRSALWPYGTLGNIGTPGLRLTNLAQAMVLTAVATTPAASAGPASVTASLALPAPGNDIEVILGSQPRDIPVLFQLFPDASGNLWT